MIAIKIDKILSVVSVEPISDTKENENSVEAVELNGVKDSIENTEKEIKTETKRRGRPSKVSEDSTNTDSEIKIETAKVEIDNGALLEAERQHYLAVCNQLGIVVDPASRIEWVKQELMYAKHRNPELQYAEFDRAAYLKATYGITESKQPSKPIKKATETQEEKDEYVGLEGDALLDSVRKECDKYGIAYGKHHTVDALNQILNVVKGRSVTQPQAQPFSMSNIENNKTELPPVRSEEQILQEWGETICGVINKHFRKMTIAEINSLVARGNYPFTHEILSTGSKAQLKLTMPSGLSKVFPSDTTHLDIFG
jgi:hypothetical protein